MKLDRNVNADGRGKYALINLRKDTIEWGGAEARNQFFVLKYRDQFCAPALRAYAAACRAFALSQNNKLRDEYLEFADEVEREATRSEQCGVRLPT